ncbi:MAG: hypothetical protein U5J83_18725 [Bryobacterales bacterium]|nr:hypothetical protein [Bryobacterales bacterium]
MEMMYSLTECSQETNHELLGIGYYKGDHKNRIVSQAIWRDLWFVPGFTFTIGIALAMSGALLHHLCQRSLKAEPRSIIKK